MINIVVELSKYVILTLMIVYTVLCYYLVVGKHASDRKGLLRSQITLTFFLDFTAFVVIFLKTFDFKVVHAFKRWIYNAVQAGYCLCQ